MDEIILQGFQENITNQQFDRENFFGDVVHSRVLLVDLEFWVNVTARNVAFRDDDPKFRMHGKILFYFHENWPKLQPPENFHENNINPFDFE